MKKTSKTPSNVSPKPVVARRSRPTKKTTDVEREHYAFDYSKARPNRFAERFATESVAVVLDPDVADVFQSSEAVNSFLRSAIAAMPQVEPRKKKRTA